MHNPDVLNNAHVHNPDVLDNADVPNQEQDKRFQKQEAIGRSSTIGKVFLVNVVDCARLLQLFCGKILTRPPKMCPCQVCSTRCSLDELVFPIRRKRKFACSETADCNE